MAAADGLEGEEDAGTGQDEADEAVGDEPVVYGMEPEGKKRPAAGVPDRSAPGMCRSQGLRTA